MRSKNQLSLTKYYAVKITSFDYFQYKAQNLHAIITKLA